MFSSFFCCCVEQQQGDEKDDKESRVTTKDSSKVQGPKLSEKKTPRVLTNMSFSSSILSLESKVEKQLEVEKKADIRPKPPNKPGLDLVNNYHDISLD